MLFFSVHLFLSEEMVN